MSVRAGADTSALNTTPQDMGAAIAEATPENNHLAEGSRGLLDGHAENKGVWLTRNLAVSIRASLNPQALPQKNSQGVWQPSPEALKAIFQQKRFTALDGTHPKAMGDLKVRLRPAPLCVPRSAHALLLHSSPLRNRAWSSTTCVSLT